MNSPPTRSPPVPERDCTIAMFSVFDEPKMSDDTSVHILGIRNRSVFLIRTSGKVRYLYRICGLKSVFRLRGHILEHRGFRYHHEMHQLQD